MANKDAAAQADRPKWHRLHPLSWLFLLGKDVQRFAIPLVCVLIFGYAERQSLWSLLGIAAVMADSTWSYLTVRYQLAPEAVIVRRGVLVQKRTVLTFARIRNVTLHQTFLHKLCGLVSLSLTTVAGRSPEVELNAIPYARAAEIERKANACRGGMASAQGEQRPVFVMSLADVLLLGLISNKGLILLGALLFALTSSAPKLSIAVLETVYAWLPEFLGGSKATWIWASLILALMIYLISRVLSLAIILIRYHEFRLTRNGAHLIFERGLLSRWRSVIARSRIHILTIQEGPLQRIVSRRSMKATTSEPLSLYRLSTPLMPLGNAKAVDSIIGDLFPHGRWPALPWQPLHSSCRLRLTTLPLCALAPVAPLLSWATGPFVATTLVVIMLSLTVYTADRQARFSAYVLDQNLIAIRNGCWLRRWRLVNINDVQALQLAQSPLDRRFGTATLWIDVPGNMSPMSRFRIRFMDIDEARRLYRVLSATLAQRSYHW